MDRWQTVQSRFVDDPSATIRDADRLVSKIMVARGYSMVEFEAARTILSMDHPLMVTHYRAAHDVALKHEGGVATTEDMRRAVVCYRELFEELLERDLASRS